MVRLSALPDNAPAETDSDHPGGNHVAISCHGINVTLAHLQKDSVRVAVGESVLAGQLIGSVGNSGYSDEPHLHLQANAADGRPLALAFNSKFIAVNDLYTSK